VEFIEELYGGKDVPLKGGWPSVPQMFRFDWDVHKKDCETFYSSEFFATTVATRIRGVGMKSVRSFIRMISPFVVPHRVYGTHAARLECVFKTCGIEAKKALDLGSHPGACASSLLKVVDKLTCVSLNDSDDEFCPYVFRDSRVDFIECDVDGYVPDKKFDVVHDDVDIIAGSNRRRADHDLALKAVSRAVRLRKYTTWYVFTVRNMGADVMLALYDAYKLYGYIDVVKPHYSNPWRTEFIVVFKNVSDVRRKRRDFLHALYAFLDSTAEQQRNWAALLSEKISEYGNKGSIEECPYRNDSDYQKELKEFFTF
jgi:hypothetical protein